MLSPATNDRSSSNVSEGDVPLTAFQLMRG